MGRGKYLALVVLGAFLIVTGGTSVAYQTHAYVHEVGSSSEFGFATDVEQKYEFGELSRDGKEAFLRTLEADGVGHVFETTETGEKSGDFRYPTGDPAAYTIEYDEELYRLQTHSEVVSSAASTAGSLLGPVSVAVGLVANFVGLVGFRSASVATGSITGFVLTAIPVVDPGLLPVEGLLPAIGLNLLLFVMAFVLMESVHGADTRGRVMPPY